MRSTQDPFAELAQDGAVSAKRTMGAAKKSGLDMLDAFSASGFSSPTNQQAADGSDPSRRGSAGMLRPPSVATGIQTSNSFPPQQAAEYSPPWPMPEPQQPPPTSPPPSSSSFFGLEAAFGAGMHIGDTAGTGVVSPHGFPDPNFFDAFVSSPPGSPGDGKQAQASAPPAPPSASRPALPRAASGQIEVDAALAPELRKHHSQRGREVLALGLGSLAEEQGADSGKEPSQIVKNEGIVLARLVHGSGFTGAHLDESWRKVYYVVTADAVYLYNSEKDAHAWNREVLELTHFSPSGDLSAMRQTKSYAGFGELEIISVKRGRTFVCKLALPASDGQRMQSTASLPLHGTQRIGVAFERLNRRIEDLRNLSAVNNMSIFDRARALSLPSSYAAADSVDPHSRKNADFDQAGASAKDCNQQ